MKLIVEESVNSLFSDKKPKVEKNIFVFENKKTGAMLNCGLTFACEVDEKNNTAKVYLLKQTSSDSFEEYFSKEIKLNDSFEYSEDSTDCNIKAKFTLKA